MLMDSDSSKGRLPAGLTVIVGDIFVVVVIVGVGITATYDGSAQCLLDEDEEMAAAPTARKVHVKSVLSIVVCRQVGEMLKERTGEGAEKRRFVVC